MSISIVKHDIIQDSGVQRAYQGVQILDSATRIVLVTGLDDGSETASATALQRAIAYVAQIWPQYSSYSPGSAAVCTGHEGVGGGGLDSDSVKVRVIYTTPVVTNTSLLTISDDTETVQDTTQLLRNDITGVCEQIVLQYQDPNNAKIKKQYIGTISFERTIRKIVLAGTILGRNLTRFRTTINSVNQVAWGGLPVAFWRYSRWNNTTNDSGRTYQITVELSADTTRDWSKYEIIKDRNTGQVITVRGNDLLQVQKAKYQPYTQIGVPGNPNGGIKRVFPYGWVNFSSLFGNGPQ